MCVPALAEPTKFVKTILFDQLWREPRLPVAGIRSLAWPSSYEKIATQSGLRVIATGPFSETFAFLYRSPIFAIVANKLQFIFQRVFRVSFCDP
jgi:hypothetical protein